MSAEAVTRLRWVRYIAIMGGEEYFRYGLFIVSMRPKGRRLFPVSAELARVAAYTTSGNEVMKARVDFEVAAQRPIMRCSNPVDLDNAPEWDGRLTFTETDLP